MAKAILRWAGRLAAALAALILVWGATGMAMAAGGWGAPPRGQMVDIGGRSLRLICEGERRSDQPTVVFEAGAFSGAADWGAIQPQVATFARACSYDRAGLGWSDPAEGPRGPVTLAADLHALLRAAGETGPYVLVGHSMAGLITRAFLAANPKEVRGLVLVDAADPAVLAIPEAQVWIARFRGVANVGAALSRFGLIKPLAPFYANRIGLPRGAALVEKRRMFGDPRTLRAAAAEIAQTGDALEGVLAADAHLANIPVAAITAGPVPDGPRRRWKEAQQRAARLSPAGFSTNVEAASHTSILGPAHGATVVDAVRRVLAAG